MRTDDKYLAYKERKKQGKIPAKNKKREQDEKYYTAVCKELEQEMRAADKDGKIYDFFSGDEITGRISWHHLLGRGAKLKDKRYLVPTINKNHLDYHFMPYDKFSRLSWYGDFLARLKNKSTEAYNKELRRRDKSRQLDFHEDFC